MALGSAIIGALRVVIGADSAALTSDLNKARGQFSEFGSTLAKGAAVATAAVAAAYGGLAISVTGAIDKMDAIGKQSQKIGIPVEQLSALSLAAATSDVSMEALGKTLGKLSKALTEGAIKPTGEAASAFKAIGLSAADMAKKLPQEQLLILADKFAGITDPTAKAALAIKLFGKTGIDLIPLLNMGREGIQEMMDAAKNFGIVIDRDTAKAAERFNDNLKMLSAAKDGIIVRLTAHLLPALEMFSQRMLAAASNTEKNQNKLDILKLACDGLARAIMVVTDNFGLLMKAFAAFVAFKIATIVIELGVAFVTLARAINLVTIATLALDVLKALGPKIAAGIVVATGGVLIASETVREKVKEVGGAVATYIGDAMSAALNKMGFNLDGLSRGLEASVSPAVRLKDAFAQLATQTTTVDKNALAGKQAFDKFIDSTNKHTAAVWAEVNSVGAMAGVRERLQIVMQANQIAADNEIKLSAKQIAQRDAAAAAAERAKRALEGFQLIYANVSPQEAYNRELEQTTKLMTEQGAKAEELERAIDKLKDKYQVSWQAIGGSMAQAAGGLQQLTGIFAKENKAMGIANKAFGIAQVAINTAIAISKANTLLPPANYAAMAAAAIVGVAQTATILAQQFATGGSFKIPGGQGGGDKVFAPLMLEPGEQVDIWRPGQRGGDPRGGAGGNVTIRIDPGPLPREWVERLIYGINDAIGDGHKLKMA